ncbi:MAG: DpnI domain-containing protein, partial [Candidatus Gracilibacteria bacterium]|nr:DpnI domain-containing protein [Candidatus Gracilibacteria bacterium]
MKLNFQTSLATSYTNNSQKIRAMSEPWTEQNIFCPNCGNGLSEQENNKKVSDFLCENCLENYEQKASKKKFKGKVISSEYYTIIKRLKENNKPNFFFLHYLDGIFSVNDFFVVPKYFFVTEIIEKRKPLSSTARRAGWTGSNILFSKIPNSGKIYYIEDGKEISKEKVLEKWQKTAFLKDIKKDDLKGWILDIMNLVESLEKEKFSLDEIYIFENDLKIIHPENKNIKAKIRQQLQFLRDKGYLEFLEKRGN